MSSAAVPVLRAVSQMSSTFASLSQSESGGLVEAIKVINRPCQDFLRSFPLELLIEGRDLVRRVLRNERL